MSTAEPQLNDRVVAFVGPLAGGEAVVAVPMARAALTGCLAAAREHGINVGFRAVDDNRDADRAADIITALAADPRVLGVVGPKNSGSAAAAVPAAVSASLPLVLPAATADDLCARGGGVVFRLCSTDAATAASAVALCAELGVTRLAVIADSTAYGKGLAAAVQEHAESQGLTVTPEAGDARAVFHAMGEVEEAQCLHELAASGYDGILIGAQGGPMAPLATLAGSAAEGAFELYAGAAVSGGKTVYAAEAYDAAALLVSAHAAAGDRKGMVAWLHEMRSEGESGPLAFTREGERQGAAVTVWRIKNGRSVPVRSQDA